jgi:DNA-binding CsgD family transcriptional regulator
VTVAVSGRASELAALRAFVESVPDAAAALVLEGEAGMGKTTLWRAGVAEVEAAGFRLLQAVPAESETTLSFSGIGDLLDPVLDETLAALPSGQKRALSCALVLEDDEGLPPDAHAVGVALLGCLRCLAQTGPVVVAVDDAQWLDAASSSGLAYAARRLRGEPVGILLARRSGLESAVVEELRRALPAERVTAVDVGPLEVDPLHHVVHDHLDVVLPRPLLAEVHGAAGGNPFYALEIVRTLRRSGISVEAGQPLPVPESLHELIHDRLRALTPESRDFLLAAAAHAHPTIDLTETASGVSRTDGLAPALEARVVELDDERVRFTHPLLAAGAYEIADPLRRREVHVRLAELLQDPEARAWQLAASVDEPSADVASALEDAARHARGRGAPRPAALLLDRARDLTPSSLSKEACRRAIDAAYLHYESGDSPRAEAQLRAVIERLPPGSQRAAAMVRLARVRAYEALREATDLFTQAVDEAEGDSETLALAHEGVATCLWRLHDRLAEAVEHAELAAELALQLGEDALAGEALGTRLVVEGLLGRESASQTAIRALALQPACETRRVLAQPRFAVAAEYLAWTGEHHRARDELGDLLRRATELGDESSQPLLLVLLGHVECELGELGSALARAHEGQDASEQSGQRTGAAHNLALESLVQARLGREIEARAAAERALLLVPATGGRGAEMVATAALGHLELARRAPDQAEALLAPIIALVRQQAIAEPGVMPYVVDRIEALIELGRADEALELLDWYEGNARRLERAAALANCARCRGLLSGQAGELELALDAFAEALDWHAQVELPLDRARTLLALGAAQRRAKQRRAARATLEEALESFERMGAALWAERVRGELKRISGRAASPGELTPAEERVAGLVAEGKTNREVAAALFLSERTVEGHLSHVFGKLGIRHRTELPRALAARQVQGVEAPNTGEAPVSGIPAAP